MLSDDAPVLKTPDAVPILDPSSFSEVQRSQNLPVLFGVSPNIIGSVGWINAYGTAVDSGSSALYWLNEGETASELTGEKPGSLDIAINASRNSAIYSGSSMQPKSLQTLPCIRI